jgi:hypothetical protein
MFNKVFLTKYKRNFFNIDINRTEKAKEHFMFPSLKFVSFTFVFHNEIIKRDPKIYNRSGSDRKH